MACRKVSFGSGSSTALSMPGSILHTSPRSANMCTCNGSNEDVHTQFTLDRTKIAPELDLGVQIATHLPSQPVREMMQRCFIRVPFLGPGAVEFQEIPEWRFPRPYCTARRRRGSSSFIIKLQQQSSSYIIEYICFMMQVERLHFKARYTISFPYHPAARVHQCEAQRSQHPCTTLHFRNEISKAAYLKAI
jgi:hypothetical protein